MAAVCFVLAVFSFIGYFDAEPVFIGFLSGFVKRLIGYGFYALPPALLLCSVVLIFHKGRPVLFRIICTFLLTIITGALVHLFSSDYEYSTGFLMLGELWGSGAELGSGGVIGGTISELFLWLFGKVGASIALIIAILFFILVAFNRTIAGIAEKIKKRERRQYIPEPNHAPEYEEEHTRHPQKHPSRMKRKRGIDIPIDGEEHAPAPEYFEKKAGGKLFRGNPGVITPDQLIREYTKSENPPDEPPPQESNIADEADKTDKADEVDEIEESDEIEDMPLDIPRAADRGREV
jgi:S-DNA-T family DNA segregation ATPase FtsK/SpoIIIE